MKIENQTYYHLQRINNINIEWKVGDEIFFNSKRENYYWQGLKQSVSLILKNYNITEDHFNVLDAIILDETEVNRTQYQLELILKQIHDTIDRNKIIQYCQEVIYEHIRIQKFNNLPSRNNCIWVVPTINDTDKWDDILPCNRKRNLKLVLTGIMHYTTGLLICTEKNRRIINAFRNAQEYWNPSINIVSEKEYLFEGSVIIDEILTINK